MNHKRILICLMAASALLTACGKGVLCLTFDDASYDNWIAALPVFEKYGAHATFFPYGRLTATNEIPKLKRLHEAGHAVGYHSLTHRDVPERLAAVGTTMYLRDEIDPARALYRQAGLPMRHFAYPNNRRDEHSDCELSRVFTRFRAGARTFDQAFFPVSELPRRRVMAGTGVGPYYKTDIADLCRGIRRAAERDEVFVLFSHNIGQWPSDVSMSRDWLEALLKAAVENGVAVKSFDELGPVLPQRPKEPLKVALTFDDGVRDHLTVVAPELEKRGWRGVFSIVTDWVGKGEHRLTWDDIRELKRRGHAIANHSKAHDLAHGGYGGLDRRGRLDEVRRDMTEAQAAFDRELGKGSVRLLCLPGSAYTENVGGIAREVGLEPMLVFRDCFGGGSTNVVDCVRLLRAGGIETADFLVHGVTPEGKGWDPFASKEAFIAYLDAIKGMETAGLLIVSCETPKPSTPCP